MKQQRGRKRKRYSFARSEIRCALLSLVATYFVIVNIHHSLDDSSIVGNTVEDGVSFLALPSNNRTVPLPRFIFGHSTGHAGTTTAHMVLKQDRDCPFSIRGNFERIPRALPRWKHTEIMANVRKDLIPFQRGRNKENFTYIDMGHFYNRARILEQLADILGAEAHFVHVRRNRYHIARSFASMYNTSCTNRDVPRSSKEIVAAHPAVSICPLEKTEQTGPVNLPFPEHAWNHRLTPFQRFLWYADEMEHRWHTLQRDYVRPTYHEVTWSTREELLEGLRQVRRSWGCSSIDYEHLMSSDNPDRIHIEKKKHVEDGSEGARLYNCSEFIRQDLEYRALAGYDDNTQSILFRRHPQRVDDKECVDTPEELRAAVGHASSFILP